MSLLNVLDSFRGMKYNFLERVTSIIPVPANLPDSSAIDFHGADSNFTLANNFYHSEDYEQCYHYLKDAIKANYKYAAPYVMMAEIYLKAKKVYEAQLILKKGIEYTGGLPVYEKLADLYQEQGLFEKVVKIWETYILESAKKSIGYYKLANFYLVQRDLNKSIEAFEHSLELEPSNIAIYEKLAELYEFTEQYPLAIKNLEKFLVAPEAEVFFRNSANKSQVNKRIGNIYFRLRNFDHAVPFYKKALQLIFNDNEVYMKLGDMCMLTKDFKNARTNYKIASQLKDDDIEIMAKLATLNFLEENYELAKAYYSRIIKFCPTILGVHAILKSIAEGQPDSKTMSEILDENTDISLKDIEEMQHLKFDGSKAAFTEEEIRLINEKIAKAEEEKKAKAAEKAKETAMDGSKIPAPEKEPDELDKLIEESMPQVLPDAEATRPAGEENLAQPEEPEMEPADSLQPEQALKPEAEVLPPEPAVSEQADILPPKLAAGEPADIQPPEVEAEAPEDILPPKKKASEPEEDILSLMKQDEEEDLLPPVKKVAEPEAPAMPPKKMVEKSGETAQKTVRKEEPRIDRQKHKVTGLSADPYESGAFDEKQGLMVDDQNASTERKPPEKAKFKSWKEEFQSELTTMTRKLRKQKDLIDTMVISIISESDSPWESSEKKTREEIVSFVNQTEEILKEHENDFLPMLQKYQEVLAELQRNLGTLNQLMNSYEMLNNADKSTEIVRNFSKANLDFVNILNDFISLETLLQKAILTLQKDVGSHLCELEVVRKSSQ
ncbi:MAG: hypothetical protein PHW04_07280 [Candidatus Wallbacteria bacterium]|nr:hypothetical protein [Candidatus Wallbacteria bacterium]